MSAVQPFNILATSRLYDAFFPAPICEALPLAAGGTSSVIVKLKRRSGVIFDVTVERLLSPRLSPEYKKVAAYTAEQGSGSQAPYYLHCIDQKTNAFRLSLRKGVLLPFGDVWMILSDKKAVLKLECGIYN